MVIIEGSLLLSVLIIYFLPTIIAIIKKKKSMVDILLFNTFLGWTIIGWIIAMFWTFFGKSSMINQPQKKVKKRESIIGKLLSYKRKL